jgi:hypothetical protein
MGPDIDVKYWEMQLRLIESVPGVQKNNITVLSSSSSSSSSPCDLTEHHAMKVHWGSGDIAPSSLDLGTRWR